MQRDRGGVWRGECVVGRVCGGGECVEGRVCGEGEQGMSETLCSGTSGPHHTIPVFSTTVAVEHAMFTAMRGFTVYHNQAVWYSNHGH